MCERERDTHTHADRLGVSVGEWALACTGKNLVSGK